MNRKISLSSLALELASEMMAGKSIQQIRAERPALSDAQFAAFIREVFDLAGLASGEASRVMLAADQRDRDFCDEHYFTLRVVLDEVKPEVWRRLVVPASITLDILHDVLQVSMGWTDAHLHEFVIDGRRFTEGPESPEDGIEENGVILGLLLRKPRVKFAYRYDFGDGWRHTITLQKIEIIPEGEDVRVVCTGGRRACPPEDVGGPWGYADFLQAIADPNHEEHESMLRWCGGEFDAQSFDADEVNLELAKLARWSRPRRK